MRRFTTSAILPMSVTLDWSGSQASPSSKMPGKFRPSDNGTYSWGIQSLATFRWRLSSFSTTSSSAYSSWASVHAFELPRWGEVIVTGSSWGREWGTGITYGFVGYVTVG